MARFDTSIKSRTVPRHFVMGRGFATKRDAAVALAKKEIAVFAAIYVRPVLDKESPRAAHPVAECIGYLFDDWVEEHPQFGAGSDYKDWVHLRAEAILKGSPALIVRDLEEVHEDCFVDCWAVRFDPGYPFPKEDEYPPSSLPIQGEGETDGS